MNYTKKIVELKEIRNKIVHELERPSFEETKKLIDIVYEIFNNYFLTGNMKNK